MRVLFSFPHAIGAPGIGWSAWNQVDGLVRRGHEVHVVAASVGRPVPGARLTTTLAAGRLRVPHRAIGRDRAFRLHDLAARALLGRDDYDVVHVWPLGTGATARAATARGIPAVREAPNTHTAHAWSVVGAEVDRLGLTGITTAHTADPVHLAMEEAEWAAATAILTPSEAVADTFVAAGFDRRRLLRHRYGFRPGTRRMRPRGVADVGGLRAVYIGLGEPRKGLHHALDAWLGSDASLTGTFTVVGRLLEPYRAHLADRLAHPSVRVVGFSSAVDAVLAAADVLVLPTFEEGSALVTYEAQGAGCVPLVSSAAGAVLDHGVEGFVHEPGDVAALQEQLDLLARDRAQLVRMSEACLRHAPELTWDAAAAALEECYERALALADGGPVASDVLEPEETGHAVPV